MAIPISGQRELQRFIPRRGMNVKKLSYIHAIIFSIVAYIDSTIQVLMSDSEKPDPNIVPKGRRMIPYNSKDIPPQAADLLGAFKPNAMAGEERAIDYSLTLAMPSMTHLSKLPAKDALAQMEGLQQAIGACFELLDETKVNAEPKIADYHSLLVTELGKFQYALSKNIESLERQEAPRVGDKHLWQPLPDYTIDIQLAHGYHADAQLEEIAQELQDIVGTFSVLRDHLATKISIKDSPLVAQFLEMLTNGQSQSHYLMGMEEAFEAQLEHVLATPAEQAIAAAIARGEPLRLLDGVLARNNQPPLGRG